MAVNYFPHLSVKPMSISLMYLKEKEEQYMYLREVYDKLVNAFAKDEKIPVEISVKLNQLSDKLDELELLIKDYRKFLEDNNIDI